MKEILLPKIPSAILLIAIDDMKKCEAAGMTLYMYKWGSGNKKYPESCSVCVAGAVMCQTTRPFVNNLTSFYILGSPNIAQYRFLDAIRLGCILRALRCLNYRFELKQLEALKNFEAKWITKDDDERPGKEDAACFYNQCKELAVYLQSINL
tara:strand:- start:7211 stop:7666 length:456 start_codon:yes stop_codon:yes gene_type:complete